ncbi:MAG TPA: SpvB/TcaC N-terminal domain-containing protein [Flavilitoribacter sp.]|nr:SpvB/TcaC N-terminal domain-containing protein [Flavilitoribacter sp.]
MPEYRDAEESDVFSFSGAEDLVLQLAADGSPFPTGDTNIKRYRPRVEGGFAKIEQIREGKYLWWKVTTRDNAVSVFGHSPECRIADPADDSRIFQWLLEFSYDDKGNCSYYQYKAENLENVIPVLHEKNRLEGIALISNKYLKRVFYGNKTPFYEGETPAPVAQSDYLFEIVVDYGEHHADKPLTAEEIKWPARPDPFSDYHAGFEIRTWRLCRRVLMYHHFKDELGLDDYLVRSLDFSYEADKNLTCLTHITQTGYIWNPDGTLRSKRSLPPMEFQYQKPELNREVSVISPENLANLPYGIDNSNYQWTDLYSEGVSGILNEQAGGWYYKENLGGGKFTPAKLVSPKPSLNGLGGGGLQLQELEANGAKYIVSTDAALKGYFELSAEAEWQPFHPFEKYPNIDLRDPNVRFLDLNGDGLADILITQDDVFYWYAAKGKAGYDDHSIVRPIQDEERGPKILFAEQNQRILIALADMSGDGMTDIVRITNEEVCYWPNLGYGRFGAKVTMSYAGSGGPLFAGPHDLFDPQYIQLADIDGSGSTDILYFGDNSVRIWFNHSGNSLSMPDDRLNPFPTIDNQSKISVIDLLGIGTACIVWSSVLPNDAQSPLRYIDLMKGVKPHVMKKYLNHLGKEVSLKYKPSTWFYLKDKSEGINWITKLPFPVQCVAKVVVEDKVSQTRFANEYTYRHGYYDGEEREFRGFALVIQKDTEAFDHYVKETQAAGALNTVERELFQPAVITKTWFHTGAFLGRDRIFHLLKDEYYPLDLVIKGEIKDPQVTNTLQPHLLPEAPLPRSLTAEEYPECLRALKGLPLRQEVYSDEGDEAIRKHPYSVSQFNYDIQRLQPKKEHHFAVFFPLEKEKLAFQYERNPLDPRIAHSMNIEIDEYGNVLQAASIVYGRRLPDPDIERPADREKQTAVFITYTENGFTNKVDDATGFRLPVLCETKTWELSPGEKKSVFFAPTEVKHQFAIASSISYHQKNAADQKRLIEHIRVLFLRNNLNGLLPLGKLESLGLPGEAYQLAMTPDMVPQLFGDKVNDTLLRNTARYVRSEGDDNYWIASGQSLPYPDLSGDPFVKTIGPATPADLAFAKSNFFMPVVYRDNFGNLSKAFPEPKYKLYVQRMVDAMDNEMHVDKFHFRTLSPWLMRDLNDNRTGVRFDELGLVTHTFTMGKEGEDLGDFLDIDSNELSAQDDPTTRMTYEFRYFGTNGQLPNRVKAEARENHRYPDPNPANPVTPGGPVIWQIAYSYSDGSGHEVLKKIQAEPGNAPLRDATGQLVVDPATGDVQEGPSDPRWVGNGRTILNNKGNPVKQYEPYFDRTEEYNDEQELVELGVTPLLYYDALGRLVKTKTPNGTFSKVAFTAWMQKTWDENDTVLESDWYAARIGGEKGPEEQTAAERAAVHSETPATVHFDSLGRAVLSIEHNKTQRSGESVTEEFYATRTDYDIEGNILKVKDARDNPVMTWYPDMLGNICRQESTDAGTRWQLNDVMGKPLCAWDSRGYKVSTEYDNLHRPVAMKVSDGTIEKSFERMAYGETISAFDPKTKNLRGQLWRHYDTAGLVETLEIDFKGNPKSATRTLLEDYKNTPDWSANLTLESETFTTSTQFDALNRPVWMKTPDNSVVRPGYNSANLLESIKSNLRGVPNETTFVTNIDYNAKGQRERVQYGNNTVTRYTYEKETFRLKRLLTTANNGTVFLQDLNYTFDPVGNITRIFDNAQKTVFYGGQRVEAASEYLYDALYRLVEATGREHSGQQDINRADDNWDDNWAKQSLQPNSPIQLREYTQKYLYDSVGNILQMRHIAGVGSWTRNNQYNPGNNQLVQSAIGNQVHRFAYNPHGSMAAMPHLAQMDWNFREELAHVDLKGSNHAWYVYDSSGQRTRKVVQGQNGAVKERIYLGSFEVYREYRGNTVQLERETLHIMDDQQRIALIETRTKGDDGSPEQLIRFQCSNHLGSSNLELDRVGQVISYEEFHPYGTTAFQAVDGDIRAAVKRYRYTGMERDEETGLNYHGARNYVHWLTRWIKIDPLLLVDGVNVYAFVKGNPIIGSDKSGLESEKIEDATYSLRILIEKRNRAIKERDETEKKYNGRISEVESKLHELEKTYELNATSGLEKEYEDLRAECNSLISEKNLELQEQDSHIKNLIFLIRKSIQAIASMKVDKNEFTKKLLDDIQSKLDLGGLIPVAGEGFDLVNAIIYAARGDYENAALSAAAMIPTGGQAATAAKAAKKAAKRAASQKAAKKMGGGALEATGKKEAKSSLHSKTAKDGVREVEFASPSTVSGKKAVDQWNDFLGPNQTDINPWTGMRDPDRVFSKDGTRSVRYTRGHEAKKSHFHFEYWGRDAETGEVIRLNVRHAYQ